jgi:uncharacterized protein
VSSETDSFLREILCGVKTIAMVGASDKEHRPSFGVFKFLLAHGYDVLGVNPNCAGSKLHGKMVYRSLADVPGPVDMVDIFRNSKAAGDAVREALAFDRRPKVIWMQLGVRNEEAARHARAAGVKSLWTAARQSKSGAWEYLRHRSRPAASAYNEHAPREAPVRTDPRNPTILSFNGNLDRGEGDPKRVGERSFGFDD